MSEQGFIVRVKIPKLGRKEIKIYTESVDDLATLERTLNSSLDLECQVVGAVPVSFVEGYNGDY